MEHRQSLTKAECSSLQEPLLSAPSVVVYALKLPLVEGSLSSLLPHCSPAHCKRMSICEGALPQAYGLSSPTQRSAPEKGFRNPQSRPCPGEGWELVSNLQPAVWDPINYSVVSVCFSDFICHQGAQNHSKERRWAELLAVKYLACRRSSSTEWYLEVLGGFWEGPTACSTVL